VVRAGDRIPIEPGLTFGVEAAIDFLAEGVDFAVATRWCFPPPGLTDPATRNLTQRSPDKSFSFRKGETKILYFTFDEPWEMVPGVWALELWSGERKLGEKRFIAESSEVSAEQEHDLFALDSKGIVRAWGTGQTITSIYAEVENLTKKKLRVTIRPGTYFVATGEHQNMVVRREYKFDLGPSSTRSVAVDAACINAARAVPGKNHGFSGVRRVSDDLARFLEASRNASPMAVQAGVWSLTDGYTGAQVQAYLWSTDQHGNRRQAVSGADISEARRILNSLRIQHNL
jgi:hypothetical protein